MFKKIIAGAIVFIVLGFSGAFIYANPADANNVTRTEEEIQQVINPSFRIITPARNVITSDTNVILSLIAPEGTTVRIDVFYNASIVKDKEKFVPSQDPIELKIGALQRGWAEVELKKGLNRIEFTAFFKEGVKDIRTRLITVKDTEEIKKLIEQSIQRIGATPSTDALSRIANIEGTL